MSKDTETKIYLPAQAKDQLERSDGWWDPIPYRSAPEKGFMYETILSEATLEIPEVIEDDLYYPDRDQDMIATLECIEKVSQEQLEALQSKISGSNYKISVHGPTHKGAIYRLFEGDDAECFARLYKGEIEVLSHQTFDIRFGVANNFYKQHEQTIDRILAEGAGIVLNRSEVVLCDGSYKKFSSKDPRFEFTREDIMSADNRTYKLFQDRDQGARGWALFTVIPRTRVRVLTEDHNDNVRHWVTHEFTKTLKNLDFKVLSRQNHEFYEKPYKPTMEDFNEAFHIDYEGSKTPYE